MQEALQDELTALDIKALAASIYEAKPRVWKQDSWKCPQCAKWNRRHLRGCTCGITRDGLPEFCER